MISVSLCMIVKDEEAVLQRCLDSIADLMDEIIIVDTGSTDATKEIASGYTDRIYDFAWTHDFAAARNFSFVKATKEYIYCADADEVLDEENRERFRQLKQTLLPEIDIVQMKYSNQLEFNTTYNFDEEYRPKLFKRLREFTWVEPIHETVRLEPVVYDSDIVICHKPVNNHAGRDFGAFWRIYESGNRLSKKLHHMYARELFIAGEDEDFLRAEPVFVETLYDTDRTLDEVKEAFCVLARCARLRCDIHSFFTNAVKCIAGDGCSEICCELGEYYAAREEYAEAAIWFFNASDETEPILNIKYGEEYPKRRFEECRNMLHIVLDKCSE